MFFLSSLLSLWSLGLLSSVSVLAAPTEMDVLDILSRGLLHNVVAPKIDTRATTYPLSTSGRWIIDANGKRVKLRCVNWAGSSETRIPEGMQMQPVDTITKWIATAGFNCVRLTYSIDLALNPDVLVSESFTSAATSTEEPSLTDTYTTARIKNPWISTSTILGVYAKIISSLNAQGLMVVLDNHNSRASWCCGTADGNGWWDEAAGYNAANSQYFNTANWLKGLAAMATFAKAYPNVIGLALRNELRAVKGQDSTDHADWYNFQSQGATAIHKANPDALVIIGGVNYAIDLSFLSVKQLNLATIGISKKAVFEFHSYAWSNSVATKDCTAYKALIDSQAGYLLTEGKAFTAPLWLSEFGWNQGSYSASDAYYRDCLVQYMENSDADWAYWALQGSYYVRDGVNTAESFGILNDDWSGWRNASFTKTIGNMLSMTRGPGSSAVSQRKTTALKQIKKTKYI